MQFRGLSRFVFCSAAAVLAVGLLVSPEAGAEPPMCTYPLKHGQPCAVYLGGPTYEVCAIHANLLVQELGYLGYLYDDCVQNDYGSWDAVLSDELF